MKVMKSYFTEFRSIGLRLTTKEVFRLRTEHNTLLFLMSFLFLCLITIDVKGQQANPVSLDAKIDLLKKEGNRTEAERLHGLYYDLNPSVFIKSDNINPVIVGKRKAKVADIAVTKLNGLIRSNNTVDFSAVELLVINFGNMQVGGIQFKKSDLLTAFPVLKYVIVLSEQSISNSAIQSMFVAADGDASFSILYKSSSEVN